jgi:electron transfer flavoprotein alpha subunit
MSNVLVFAESRGGKFKKSAFEVVTYGKKTADKLGGTCIVLTLGASQNAAQLGIYGADQVLMAEGSEFDHFDGQVFATAIAEVAAKHACDVVVISHTAAGKAMIGRLSVKMNAGCVSGANAVPEVGDGFEVSKHVFSGKATTIVRIKTDNKVISVMGNSIQPLELGAEKTPESIELAGGDAGTSLVSFSQVEGTVPLPEAELVVSAGRGMKDPDNWGIVEELAEAMGATTACSRPVSDADWRPHHEHVGQTGLAIRPNLYLAIGISGAIQHLAGVNNSKVIVVINKDPEAPFFKAADYGVCADLFEVVPKLTEAVRKFKSA